MPLEINRHRLRVIKIPRTSIANTLPSSPFEGVHSQTSMVVLTTRLNAKTDVEIIIISSDSDDVFVGETVGKSTGFLDGAAATVSFSSRTSAAPGSDDEIIDLT
jgi:hypothetical protein